jgi:hypothetical protein
MEQSEASDFYYTVDPPIKNVVRIRVTSLEFPNNYAFFNESRNNIDLRILYAAGDVGQSKVITIPVGNYTADDMVTALKLIFEDAVNGLTWLDVEFNPITGQFTFTGTQKFGIDATYRAYDRAFDYGLAYYLGFTRKLHIASQVCLDPLAKCWKLVSDTCANFAGDSYVFLKVNDYNCVRHNTGSSTITALAKIVLREPKSYMVFDDYAGQHAKEVVFPTPQNISRLHIQILDPYGEVIDLCSANFSFSLEITEVQNSSLYNAFLGSQAAHYF